MKKPFTMIAVAIFSLIAMLQLVRFVLGWQVSVEGIAIPVWASGIACAVAAGLAVMVWREASR